MASSKSIIRTDSLSTDRIDGQVNDDFILCPICSNILWKPIACKTCENAFCLKCIRLWLNEKPNTCPYNCHFQERKAPPILMKLLAKLKLSCRHQSNGCTLSIPYEALEKHELQECQFRLILCPACSEEMFQKDYDAHQEEKCASTQVTCLKCDTEYKRSQGHSESQCFEKQMATIKEKLDASEHKPKRVEENYNKMVELFNRQHLNDSYARRSQLFTDVQDCIIDNAPSAPVYESFSPSPDDPGPSAAWHGATNTTPEASSSNGSLRLSTIDFSQIPRSRPEGDHIPNGYAGFNWENAYYIFQDYTVAKHHLKGFWNAYTNSRKCVAYNGKGSPMSVFLPNARKTFGFHSFEAISIYHSNFKLSVTAYLANSIYDTRNVTLTNTKPTLFEIDWEQVDRITFTPERILETGKPATFALTCLNLLL